MDLIVARYKEDISWLGDLNANIIIYNKFYDEGNLLPNIGREAHTYLYHIINNYDNLTDIVGFIQGDATENNIGHREVVTTTINNLNQETVYPIYFGRPHTCDTNGLPHHAGLPISNFLSLFDMDTNTINFYSGAQFIVTKSIITSRPRGFYQQLLNMISEEPNSIEAYVLERIWPYIFDSTINLKQSYES
jgi:hypothetical protein